MLSKIRQTARRITPLLFMSGMGLGSLLYFMTWNGDAIRVLPLQLSVWSGTDSPSTHFSYAKICLKNNLIHCAREGFLRTLTLDPDRSDALLELGKIELRSGAFESAVSFLSQYVERGGEDRQARFYLARAYSQSDQAEQAIEIFEDLLNEKKGVVQVSVVKEYVLTLMKVRQWRKAKKNLDLVRANSSQNRDFMSGEYKLILNSINDLGGKQERSLASH